MDECDPPPPVPAPAPAPESKLTRSKQRWASERRFLTGPAPSADPAARLPPGQHLVRDWPVLDLGQQPDIATDRFTLRAYGLVANAVTLDWAGLQALPQSERVSDMHCVTTWSRLDNRWRGVLAADLLDLVRPLAAVSHVVLHAHDGYATNLPLADFAAPDSMLVTHWQGAPIGRAHGGPVRSLVPHLYLWKSAKWLSRVEFLAADRPGFWERRGYHRRGDPWAEERYG